MYLIPLIRTSRSIAACTILPEHPLLAITISEIGSYTLPFINNNPLYAFNNMSLFLLYYYYYNEHAIHIINTYKNKYMTNYNTEAICILLYLFIYTYKISE